MRRPADMKAIIKLDVSNPTTDRSLVTKQFRPHARLLTRARVRHETYPDEGSTVSEDQICRSETCTSMNVRISALSWMNEAIVCTNMRERKAVENDSNAIRALFNR